MVVACLIVFVATLNPKQSWMLKRIQTAANPSSSYVAGKIGPRTDDPSYKQRYDAYYGALVKTYAENAYYIKVPALGFSYDINDLEYSPAPRSRLS